MRRIGFRSAVGLGLSLALLLGVGSARAGEKKTTEPTCGDHGTSVKFYDDPSIAAKQALKEEKLVFVLHISGNFENPDQT